MKTMQNIELLLKKLLIKIIGALRPAKRIHANQIPFSRMKRILIVKQHDQLGDLLVTTPAIRALRKRFPEAHIAIVVREYTAPMIWENPNVDSIIVFYEKFKRWDFRKFRSFWDQLRSGGGFDCAIMFNSVSRSLSSDCIAAISKAKYIIGPNHIVLDPDIPENIYNVLTVRSRKIQPECEHYLDIVRALGAQSDGTEYDLLVTDEEDGDGEKVIYEIGIRSGTNLIGIHFGALNKEKRFPLEKLAKAVEWIKTKYACEILLIPGPNEHHLLQDLIGRIKNAEVRTLPVQSLRTACAVIKKLNLLICNDTGTLHIAAAMKVPTISFHSISDPAQWKPPHERHIALQAEDKRIASISVEMVIAAVQSQFQAAGIQPKAF